MSENHRGPKVPEEEVPVVACRDGLARITSNELATTHFVKSGTLQNPCSTRRVVADFGKRCSYAHRKVEEQRSRRSLIIMSITEQGDLFWDVYFIKYTTIRLRIPGYGSILRKSSDIRNSIRCVKFIHKKPLYITLTFETKILRSEWFAQVDFISVAPTLQNLRIGLKRRQSGKSKVPAKQRGSWPKVFSN